MPAKCVSSIPFTERSIGKTARSSLTLRIRLSAASQSGLRASPVDFQYVWQNDGVGPAVRNAVLRAQLVCNRMHIAQARLVECKATIVCGKRHCITGFVVLTVFASFFQMFEHKPHTGTRVKFSLRR